MKLFKSISNSIIKALSVIDRLLNSCDNLAKVVEAESTTILTEHAIESRAGLKHLTTGSGLSDEELNSIIASIK